MGGAAPKPNIPYKYIRSNKTGEKAADGVISEMPVLDINELDNLEVSVLENHVEAGMTLFARADRMVEPLAPSSLVGYFDINNTKIVRLNFV